MTIMKQTVIILLITVFLVTFSILPASALNLNFGLQTLYYPTHDIEEDSFFIGPALEMDLFWNWRVRGAYLSTGLLGDDLIDRLQIDALYSLPFSFSGLKPYTGGGLGVFTAEQLIIPYPELIAGFEFPLDSTISTFFEVRVIPPVIDDLNNITSLSAGIVFPF